MAVTPGQQQRYFRNIQEHLHEIGELVGFPVDLFTAPTENWLKLTPVKVPQDVDFYNTGRGYILIAAKEPKQPALATFPYGDRVLLQRWQMVMLPGCCALCISTAVTALQYHGKGVNNFANKIRQEIAKIAGYTAMVCTDVDTNERERKTLAKNKWADVYKVKNRRTLHNVILSVKELEHDGD